MEDYVTGVRGEAGSIKFCYTIKGSVLNYYVIELHHHQAGVLPTIPAKGKPPYRPPGGSVRLRIKLDLITHMFSMRGSQITTLWLPRKKLATNSSMKFDRFNLQLLTLCILQLNR